MKREGNKPSFFIDKKHIIVIFCIKKGGYSLMATLTIEHLIIYEPDGLGLRAALFYVDKNSKKGRKLFGRWVGWDKNSEQTDKFFKMEMENDGEACGLWTCDGDSDNYSENLISGVYDGLSGSIDDELFGYIEEATNEILIIDEETREYTVPKGIIYNDDIEEIENGVFRHTSEQYDNDLVLTLSEYWDIEEKIE